MIPNLTQEQATYRQINRLDLLRGSLGWESILAGRFSSLDHAFRTRRECMDIGRAIARSHGRQDGTYQHREWDYFELAELYRVSGNLAEAQKYYQLAEEIFQSKDNPHGLAYSRRAKGDLTFAHQKYDQALIHYQRNLELARETLFFVDVGVALVRLSRTLTALGRTQESEIHLRESLVHLDNPVGIEAVNWPVLALAECRAAQQKVQESALLASFVLRHPQSWLEMRHIAEELLQQLKPTLDADFEVDRAAKLAAETLIPDLIQTPLPPLSGLFSE